MRIRLNGAERELSEGTTVADLVAELGLRAAQVAVERNHELVAREQHAGTVLVEGDRVEVVTLVGGG